MVVCARRSLSYLSAALVLLVTLVASKDASAIGFGVGAELGGFAGGSQLLSGGIAKPNTFGGGLALVLSTELYDENFLRLQGIGRLEGNGFVIQGEKGGGAGGAGGGEILLRAGLALPLSPVEPFLEVGGGALFGGGAGTADLSGIGQAVDQAVSGAMWAPAGYLGVGVTIALPLLPYFEARVGTHVGGLVPLTEPPPIQLSGMDALVGRAELHLGMGFRL